MREKFLNSINLIRRFRWNSIFFENLKMFTMIIVIPVLLIVGSLFWGYKHSIDRSTKEIALQNNIKLVGFTEKLIAETEQMYYMWVVDDNTMMFYSADKEKILTHKYIKAMREINKFSGSYARISDCVESVDFYSFNADYVLSSTNENGYSENYENLSLKNIKSKELSFLAPVKKKGKELFAICYNVVVDGKVGGIIVFNINPEIYEDVISDAMIKSYSVSLLDNMHHPVMSIGETKEFAPDFENDGLLHQEGNKIKMTGKVGEFWIYFDAETTQISMSMLVVIILSIVISVMLSLFLALMMSLHSYRVLDELVYVANGGSADQKMPQDTMNEINFIRDRLIFISRDNENMSAELIENASMLKKLQLQMLQTQFTPHFLFNTLQMLSWNIAREYGIESPAGELIALTSDLLAISLDTSKQLVSIRQEIEYNKKYLKIMRIINKNNFEVVWEVDDTLLQYKTLKLSLQSVLENAIKHGVKTLCNQTMGYIYISIFEQDNSIIFEVKNNGRGIDEKNFRGVREELDRGIFSTDKQIGLRNINKRIKLIFGNEYGCSISAINGLAVVKIKIPKQST